MKYTLIAEDEIGSATTTREFQADYLPDVLSEIELFLRGAGILFKGNLGFVDALAEIDFELKPDCNNGVAEREVLATKSPHYSHYFDTERNK